MSDSLSTIIATLSQSWEVFVRCITDFMSVILRAIEML